MIRFLFIIAVTYLFCSIIGLHPIAYYWKKWRTRNDGESEFGSGRVVCLVKFMEHMNNSWAHRVADAYRWSLMTPQARAVMEREAERFPHGNYARLVANVRSVFISGENRMARDISHAIEMWMNGASDHFYGLDRSRNCPDPLIELAHFTLAIGHGFTDNVWDYEKVVEKINRLVQESALALDESLHVVGDWGEW